ncbi:hypothetical protein HDU98_005995, partial [Podochytrium sp. JEL0797]
MDTTAHDRSRLENCNVLSNNDVAALAIEGETVFDEHTFAGYVFSPNGRDVTVRNTARSARLRAG